MAQWTYLHHLDPFFISFSENFGIRWYGLAYIVGFIFLYFFMVLLQKTQRTPLSKKDMSDLINYGIAGVLIGGRLGYCIFYQPELWLKWGPEFPFWGVLEIHQGGMSSHGGVLGVFIICAIFALRKKISFLHLLDIGAWGAGIGFFLGRLANFINGELYGRIIEKKAWFGVQFPSEIYTWRGDTEKLMLLKKVIPYVRSIKNPFSQGQLDISENLWQSWVMSKKSFTGEILSVLGKIQNLVEQGQPEVISALSEILPIRHPSQLYQAFLEGLIPFIVVSILWRMRFKMQGFIAGIWAVLYLSMRIIGELFREPDSYIGFDFLGLTRGQWLSAVALIFVMIYFYFILKKHKYSFFFK